MREEIGSAGPPVAMARSSDSACNKRGGDREWTRQLRAVLMRVFARKEGERNAGWIELERRKWQPRSVPREGEETEEEDGSGQAHMAVTAEKERKRDRRISIQRS